MAAPGRLADAEARRRARARWPAASRLLDGLDPPPRIELVESGDGNGPLGSDAGLAGFLEGLGVPRRVWRASAAPPELSGRAAGRRGPAGPANP